MKLATFNINGIKARIEALPAWLSQAAPDVVCLQEIKSVDEAFPRGDFEAMGYQVETHGQKGFNGVAILSKLPLSDVRRGLPGTGALDRGGGRCGATGARLRALPAERQPCAGAEV
jgi:exodeoxyribonuclease III